MSETVIKGVPASDLPSPIGRTREAEQVDGVKARLAQLRAQDDELTIERATAEREAVRAEMVTSSTHSSTHL